MVEAYDPGDPAVRRDPFPLFARLQEEEPVQWSPAVKAWIVTRYDDVRAVTLDGAYSAERMLPFYERLPDERQARIRELLRYLSLWMVFRDPPEHTRLRRLMNRAFTPGAVEALRPRVEAIVESLLDGLEGRGEVDFIADFAMPLPALVVMSMLGVPPEQLAAMKGWSDDMAVFVGSARGSRDKYERAERGAREMAASFRALIEARRAAPAEDLTSALIAARDEREALSDDELVASCMLLLFAGHETTTNLIGNAVLWLCRKPELQEELRARPALIESAVEEFLRFDGPSHGLGRVVAREHELRGRRLRPGERLFALMNAANRDPRAFDSVHEIRLDRSPNRNLTFGHGIHFCLGAPLARLEAQVALPRLLERFPGLGLASGELRWLDSMILRGVEALPLRLRSG